MGIDSFAYKLVLVLHIGCVVVGFGSSFVYPMLASKAKALPPKEAYAVNHTAFSVSKYLTSFPIYAAGGFGILLVILSGEFGWKFSDKWISIAFLLFIIAVAVAVFLHVPNLKAMDALAEKLANAEAGGAPPKKQLAELQERAQKAAAFGGVLHLMWLLLMLDMVFKPFMSSTF